LAAAEWDAETPVTKQKPLTILAVAGLALVLAYFLYDRMRPACDSIFDQTATKVGGSAEVLKTKGELFVGREKIQELAESSQKVALHLKACCVAQRSGNLNAEQLQGCMNGAKEYESKLQQVGNILNEAQAAKDQGNQQVVEQKTAQAKEAVSAASRTASELAGMVHTLPASQGAPATEKHTLSMTNFAATPVTVSVNGTWVGQWDTNTGSIPLDSVVQGKNELTLELQGAPQSQVSLEVWAKRSEGDVNLLRMNFQGKPAGKYTYTFVAR
jgi:hypothetical protein